MQRVNPVDKDAAKKWYVTQVTTSQVDETQVVMDLAEETTLNPSEAMMAIRQLRKILLHRLLGGATIGGSGRLECEISPSTEETLLLQVVKTQQR